MIINSSIEAYWSHFHYNPHPYISKWFIKLVESKADEIVYLMSDTDKSIGIIAGINKNEMISPFSAPFGGFHYSHEHLMYDTIYNFLSELKDYAIQRDLTKISITLPPDIYQTNINAKFVNAFTRLNYKMSIPNLLNWTDLVSFNGEWVYNKVLNRCKKAIKSELRFEEALDEIEKRNTYELIKQNRIGQNREIHMSFNDLLKINDKIPVDFLQVKEKDGNTIGAGILYRGNKDIVQGIFMGDDLTKRDLGAIDFLYMNIYEFYKNLGYKYVDLGTSSVNGEPNIGLLRFKEIHNCKTSLQYSFIWSKDN